MQNSVCVHVDVDVWVCVGVCVGVWVCGGGGRWLKYATTRGNYL